MRLYKTDIKRSKTAKRLLLPLIAIAFFVVAALSLQDAKTAPQSVTHAASSNKIVFSSHRDESAWHIYSMNSDGSDQTQLTNTSDSDNYPSWSPDGSQITFSRSNVTDDSEDIYVMNADGSNARRLSTDGGYNYYATWAPDGSKIAYIHVDISDYSTSVYTMNPDGSNPVQVAISDYSAGISWSPDSSKLLTTCYDGDNSQLCTMNLDGSDIQMLTNEPKDHYSPKWAPDGSKIAYLVALGGYISPVVVMNPDGTDATTVPNTTSDNNGVDWSPDSSTLVYAGYETLGDQVFTIKPDGSSKTTLTDTSSSNVQPAWTTYPLYDSDHDGQINEVENSAPNSGDANNDGIADSSQPNVTSLVNPLSGKDITIQSNCLLNTNASVASSSPAYPDTAFAYSNGMLSFTVHCATPGTTATVTLYYYGVKSDGLTARKYNVTTHTYQAIPGAAFSQVTIAGHTVTKLVYSVTDGGPLDQDGVANGLIVDPVGLGVSTVGTPDTGMGGVSESPFAHLKDGKSLVVRSDR